MCLCVHMCTWMQVFEEANSILSTATGDRESFELPAMSVGHLTQVMWKNNTHA